jgi:hypothetical protein
LGGAIVIYSKLTYGYVVQRIDSETGDCVSMEFVPDGRIDRQTDAGETFQGDDAAELENMEKECSLDMVQP